MKRLLLNITVVLLSLTLISCGFYLRGRQPIPEELQVLALNSDDPYSNFTQALATALRNRGITVVEPPTTAPFMLYVFDEEVGEEMGGVSSADDTRQYMVSFSVMFQIQDTEGKILVGPRRLSTRRSLVVPISQLLGATNEQVTYMREMRQEMVVSIMSQLTSLGTVRALERAAAS
ncbi:MAG: LPS assembly lipoprotein LptE [Gammaproteobacteria bacterium]